MITMTETQAQRDAERVREHGKRALDALVRLRCVVPYFWHDDSPHIGELDAACQAADEAIEYATGAHEPDSYSEVKS